MERLYSPWRDEYVKTHKKDKKCVFCNIVKHTTKDKEFRVLYRDRDCFVIMNKYPYTPGHFMLVPNLHTDSLDLLPVKTWIKMSLFAQQGVKLLKEVMNAQGVNLGMNLGKIGGAGIAEHIHYHLVPRWLGDTNFITSIGDTRIYSTDFDRIYKVLCDNSHKYFKNV